MPPDIKMPDTDQAKAHAQSLINSIEAAQQRFACEACGKIYTSPYSRDRHMHLHTGEKRFTCPFDGCGKRFARRDSLKSHFLVHERYLGRDPKDLHPDESSRDGEIGDFRQKLGLVCEWEDCGQIFSHQADLIRHRRSHGDLRPVKCPFCGKGLSRMDKLKPHVKVHHGTKGPRSPEPNVESETLASNRTITTTKRRPSRFVNTFIERPDMSRAKRRPSRPGIYQCPLCPKSFDSPWRVRRHVESSVHNLIVIGPSTAPDERSTPATDSEKSGYAQECVGCRQIFVDEPSFFDHAPCYRLDVEQQDEQSDAAEVEQEYSEREEESEDDADQLDDLEAQLVAAANGQNLDNAVENRADTAPRSPHPASPVHRSPAANPTPEGVGERTWSQDHQYDRLPHKDLGAIRHRSGEPSVQTSTASGQRLTGLLPPAEHRHVPASALTPLRGATRMLIGARESGKSHPSPPPPYHAPTNSQNLRRCYGCEAGFSSKKAFWNHSPCFTTTVQPVVRSQDKRGTTGNQTLQRSATPDKHDSGQEMVGTELKPPAKQTDDSSSSAPFVEDVPSLKVQHLLISIAQRNPAARPIPPSELASLTDKSPNLLELVTRMERENAEMQRIVK